MERAMPKYYEDLTLKEMFKYHDHTYMMADDSRSYENGKRQREIMHAKVKENGGWTQELVDLYNKYAPKDFELDYELIKIANKNKRNGWNN
tara:strand:- start:44 stop:316 length:273 start_codon:yes stop_codon:yes gene_type:complete